MRPFPLTPPSGNRAPLRDSPNPPLFQLLTGQRAGVKPLRVTHHRRRFPHVLGALRLQGAGLWSGLERGPDALSPPVYPVGAIPASRARWLLGQEAPPDAPYLRTAATPLQIGMNPRRT